MVYWSLVARLCQLTYSSIADSSAYGLYVGALSLLRPGEGTVITNPIFTNQTLDRQQINGWLGQ